MLRQKLQKKLHQRNSYKEANVTCEFSSSAIDHLQGPGESIVVYTPEQSMILLNEMIRNLRKHVKNKESITAVEAMNAFVAALQMSRLDHIKFMVEELGYNINSFVTPEGILLAKQKFQVKDNVLRYLMQKQNELGLNRPIDPAELKKITPADDVVSVKGTYAPASVTKTLKAKLRECNILQDKKSSLILENDDDPGAENFIEEKDPLPEAPAAALPQVSKPLPEVNFAEGYIVPPIDPVAPVANDELGEQCEGQSNQAPILDHPEIKPEGSSATVFAAPLKAKSFFAKPIRPHNVAKEGPKIWQPVKKQI